MSITKISPDVVDFDSALVVSPTLTIGDATAEDTKIVFDGNAQDYYIGLDDSDDDLIIGLGSTVGTTPAIVIDTSGNFMVGTTDPDNQNNSAGSAADNGFAYGGTNGYLNVARYNGIVSYFNRTSTDGVITQFRKDGSEVGGIGAVASQMYIAGGDTGLQLNGTADQIRPCDASGAARDAAIDLGDSTRRFKDLYLSGGVVFDAVAGGATSNTLDDYEEGSFTIGVTGSTASLGNATAYYTKIGDLVYWFWYSASSTFSSSSGTATLTGLPFTQDGQASNYGTFQYVHGNGVDGNSTGGYVTNNSNQANFIDAGGVGGSTFIDGGSKYIMASGIYKTDA